LDLKSSNSSNSGCTRLGSGLALPLGVVEKEVAVLIILVRRHRRAVGAAVRRTVDDEVFMFKTLASTTAVGHYFLEGRGGMESNLQFGAGITGGKYGPPHEMVLRYCYAESTGRRSQTRAGHAAQAYHYSRSSKCEKLGMFELVNFTRRTALLLNFYSFADPTASDSPAA